MSEDNDIQSMYQTHIAIGENLLQKLSENTCNNISGALKLQRKIKKDILFLLETFQTNKLKKEHLVCSNLHYYRAVVQEIENQPECVAILEPFSYKVSGCQKQLAVDVVSSKGQRWIKVIARNPLALQQIYKEGDSFGRRSIMDQATSYVQAAAQNLYMYCPPQVVFSFVNGVPEEMKTFLEKLGIEVEGNVIKFERNESSSSSESELEEEETSELSCHIDTLVPIKQKNLSRLNLCVTTMIAYVSSLTNGGCNYKFAEPLLNEQAEWERERPVKPLLQNLFKGKELISCSTAVEDFKNIIGMVGGEEETQRAFNLLSNIRIVPDAHFDGLKPSGKIKKRSLLIFGTGHLQEAVTVTANKGFVLAAKQKGITFAVIIHESRALTERKQLGEEYS